MNNSSKSLPLQVRRHATLRLWFVNFACATGVGANYLAHVPEVEGPRMWLFALPALLSTAVILTAIPAALFWLAARYVSNARVLGFGQSAFWTLFQVCLFADTRIYNMFQYHLNGQVWNLVSVRGSEDTIHLGWQVWTAIIAGLSFGIAAQTWLWRRALEKARLKHADAAPRTRARLAWSLLLLPLLFEKTLYARADLSRDHQITNLAHIFPLYARLPAKDFASNVLGVDLERAPRVELEGIELDYPHARPAMAPDGARPNVLMLVVDCLRRDRMTSEFAPHISDFALESRVFENHVSAGNSTRYGIFALIYGLYGSYWFPVLESRTPPVLIETLDELGYEFGVFGSASMGYPELRGTAWSSIEDDVHDGFEGEEPWQRDVEVGAAMVDWIESKAEKTEPFFGFLLLDSPHQTYSHPPSETPFTPSAPELDYMSMTQNEGPDPELLESVINRYNNAVHHADDVLGNVLDAIQSSPHFENTIILITGDHGEEFLECGFFGHTSAFTSQQLSVPFLLRGPGIVPGVEDRPTSHLDFAPTLLEYMGANPHGRETWCQGENLLEPVLDRRRVMSGWNVLGVWTPNGILRVPLSKFEFDIQVFDSSWELVSDDLDILKLESGTLESLGAECNRFLR